MTGAIRVGDTVEYDARGTAVRGIVVHTHNRTRSIMVEFTVRGQVIAQPVPHRSLRVVGRNVSADIRPRATRYQDGVTAARKVRCGCVDTDCRNCGGVGVRGMNAS